MSDARWPLVDVGHRDPDEEREPEPVDPPSPDEYEVDPGFSPVPGLGRAIGELTFDELNRELAFGSAREFVARAELERRAAGRQPSLFGPLERLAQGR